MRRDWGATYISRWFTHQNMMQEFWLFFMHQLVFEKLDTIISWLFLLCLLHFCSNVVGFSQLEDFKGLILMLWNPCAAPFIWLADDLFLCGLPRKVNSITGPLGGCIWGPLLCQVSRATCDKLSWTKFHAAIEEAFLAEHGFFHIGTDGKCSRKNSVWS
jgi:hypothetical protein